MKTKWILTTIMTLSMALGFSQSRLSEEKRQELRQQHQAYREKLHLSAEQSSQMEAINMAYFEQLASLKASSGSRISKYKKYKQLSGDREEKVKNVLTREQFRLFKEHQKDMKDDFREARKSS